MENTQQVAEVPADTNAQVAIPVDGTIPACEAPAVAAEASVAAAAVAAEAPQILEGAAVQEAPVPVPMTVDTTPAPAVVAATAVAVATAMVDAAPAEPAEAAPTEPSSEVSDGSGPIKGAMAVVRRQKRSAKRRAASATAVAASGATAAPIRKRLMSGRFLDRIIKSRRARGAFYHSQLFRCERSDIINADGDIRHFGCVAVSQLGPYAPGEKIEVIDWLGSANLLFVSQTGKIADTVVLPLTGGAIENQTPIEP